MGSGKTLSPDDVARLRGLVADNTFTSRFELEQEIGAGGMGRVFVATEIDKARKVAIKLLDVKGDVERFAAEAEILESLEHPAIVSFVAHGLTTDGRAYLAMTWLEGESLATRLARGPLSALDAAVVGARVAGALAYLHGRKIVHRDIKPSNVFLVGGDPAAATVIDLGIAKQLDASEKLTRTGQLIGTPGYMAPEQVMGEATIDGRVDLFALGCLLHETLCGEMPFPGAQVMEVLAQLLLHDPKPLDAINPAIPARFATLVSILLSKEAEDRTVDAAATASELSAIAAALSAGDTAALAMSPYARPKLALAPTVQERVVRNDPPAAPDREKSGSRIVPIIAVIAPVVAVMSIAFFIVYTRTPSATSTVEKIAVAVPSGPIMLPATADVVRKPGPLVTGIVVERATPELLGIDLVVATWCAASQRAVAVGQDGRVFSIPRATAVPRVVPAIRITEPATAIAVCLANGRVLIATRAGAFAIGDHDAVIVEVGFPANVVHGIAVADGARWVAPGAIWSWDGIARPAKVRETCGDPKRLAPDGEHVACRKNGVIVVEHRTEIEPGPRGQTARWSDDGKSLFVDQGTSHVTWELGTPADRVGDPVRGKMAVQVGPWLVATPGKTLTRRGPIGSLIGSRLARIGSQLAPIGSGLAAERVKTGATKLPDDVFDILAILPVEHEVLVVTEGRPRFVAIERDELPPPRTPPPARILALAFHPAGDSIATADEANGMGVRAIANGSRTSFDRADYVSSSARLTWRADGLLVLSGSLMLDGWSAAGVRRKISEGAVDANGIASTTGVITGTDDVVRASSRGIEIASVDGGSGGALTEARLPEVRWVEVEQAKQYALLDSTRSARIVALPSGAPVVEIAELQNDRQIAGLALVGGERPAMIVADTFDNVFVVDARGARPLARLSRISGKLSIISVMARPGSRHVAVAAGREVIVFDVDSGTELARGELETPVSAIAWDRAGKRIAAAGYATELQVLDVP